MNSQLLDVLISVEDVQKMFERFKMIYGGAWTSRCESTDAWQECLELWHDGISMFRVGAVRLAFKDIIANNKTFPPTLGQLIELCLHHSGVPSEDEVFRQLIKKDFQHPLTHTIFKRIGSWDLSHDSEAVLKKRIAKHYPECLNNILVDSAFLSLPARNAQLSVAKITGPKQSSAKAIDDFPLMTDDYKKDRESVLAYHDRLSEYRRKQCQKELDEEYPERLMEANASKTSANDSGDDINGKRFNDKGRKFGERRNDFYRANDFVKDRFNRDD